MSDFWREAAQIFETAKSGDSNQPDFAIVLGHDRQLRIVDATGWSSAALQSEYNAQTTYRVSRRNASISVEAHSGAERCIFWHAESILPATIPQYKICQP